MKRRTLVTGALAGFVIYGQQNLLRTDRQTSIALLKDLPEDYWLELSATTMEHYEQRGILKQLASHPECRRTFEQLQRAFKQSGQLRHEHCLRRVLHRTKLR
jgi:hypothetical protein